MENHEIAKVIKEIVVDQYGKELQDRDWYRALGELIDKLEGLEND
tara:strand:+ start:409 stop:543 length:135 start_codon:yes stop_codon:yes gene_type:complete